MQALPKKKQKWEKDEEEEKREIASELVSKISLIIKCVWIFARRCQWRRSELTWPEQHWLIRVGVNRTRRTVCLFWLVWAVLICDRDDNNETCDSGGRAPWAVRTHGKPWCRARRYDRNDDFVFICVINTTIYVEPWYPNLQRSRM